jgi:hypothetical protein
MEKVLVLKKKDQPDFRLAGVRELHIDFMKNVMRVEYYDATGPHTGEYALDQYDDFDWL